MLTFTESDHAITRETCAKCSRRWNGLTSSRLNSEPIDDRSDTRSSSHACNPPPRTADPHPRARAVIYDRGAQHHLTLRMPSSTARPRPLPADPVAIAACMRHIPGAVSKTNDIQRHRAASSLKTFRVDRLGRAVEQCCGLASRLLCA
jgi:hypothetical protein